VIFRENDHLGAVQDMPLQQRASERLHCMLTLRSRRTCVGDGAACRLAGATRKRTSSGDRRFGEKIESPLIFYPRYVWQTLRKAWGYLRVYRQLRTALNEALTAPDRWTYSDIAIAPPQQNEFDRLSLYHETTGGEAALARKRRDDAIRVSGRAPEVAAAAE
jgi:hypothetical protein